MEINEATANKLGIADGEKVRVISRRGKIVDENVLTYLFIMQKQE